MRCKIISMVFIVLINGFLFSLEMKFLGKTRLQSKGDSFLAGPTSFTVTEDNLICVTDYKAANIKIFTTKGDFVKAFGMRGSGPNEFFGPFFIDYYKSRFAILDIEKRRIFIYKRKEQDRMQFQEIKQILCIAGGDQVHVLDEQILVAGFKEDNDGSCFDLYAKNLNNDFVTYLLPSQVKYGLDSYSTRAFLNEYRNNPKITTIGIGGYCDWFGEHAYYLWEGDLRIIDVNLKTKKITTFGNKTKSYTTPDPSTRMKNAYKSLMLDSESKKLYHQERQKLTYINGIFTGKNFVSVFYTQPIKNNMAYNLIFQFYTPDGKFIGEVNKGEVEFPPSIYFKKDENKLFVLTFEETNDDEIFYISTYKIEI
jgi:hypothetical protein